MILENSYSYLLGKYDLMVKLRETGIFHTRARPREKILFYNFSSSIFVMRPTCKNDIFDTIMFLFKSSKKYTGMPIKYGTDYL